MERGNFSVSEKCHPEEGVEKSDDLYLRLLVGRVL